MTIVVDNKDFSLKRLELGYWATNNYLLVCKRTRQCVIIDAPADANAIIKNLEGTEPKYVLLTHNHFDHFGALMELSSALKVPTAAHAADAIGLPFTPELILNDGDIIRMGELNINVLHTPGHTPGSLCFRVDKYLLSGDTIFPGGPGHTGSPVTFNQILKSIQEKILVLPGDTQVFPGHGLPTTLKKEKEELSIFLSRPHAQDLCGDVLWLSS